MMTKIMIWIPCVLAVASAWTGRMWLVPVTVISMFLLVGILPFTHKRENLWLFLLWFFCSIPINLLIIKHFSVLGYVLDEETPIFVKGLVIAEIIFIATSAEEVAIALIGRRIWRRQYALSLPKLED